ILKAHPDWVQRDQISGAIKVIHYLLQKNKIARAVDVTKMLPVEHYFKLDQDADQVPPLKAAIDAARVEARKNGHIEKLKEIESAREKGLRDRAKENWMADIRKEPVSILDSFEYVLDHPEVSPELVIFLTTELDDLYSEAGIPAGISHSLFSKLSEDTCQKQL